VRIIRSGARGQRNAGASPVLGTSDVGAIVRVEQNAGVVSFPTASSDRAQPITVVVEDDGISGPLLVELSGSFSVRGNLVSSHYMTAGQSHTFEPNLTGQWELRSALDPEVTFDRTTPDATPNLIGDDESLKTFLNYLTSVGFLGARVFLRTPLDILDNPDFPLHNHRFAAPIDAFNDISFTGTSTIAAPPAGDFLSVEFEGVCAIATVMAAPALSTAAGVVLNGVDTSYDGSFLILDAFGAAPLFELAPTGPGGALFFVNCGVLNMSAGAVSQDPSTSAFPIQAQISASLSMSIASDAVVPEGAASAIQLRATEAVGLAGGVGSITAAILNTAGVGWSGGALVFNGLTPSARQADSPVDSYAGPADAGGSIEVLAGGTYALGGASGAGGSFKRPTTVVYNDTAGAPASITSVSGFEVMGATKPRIALSYPGEVAVMRNQWDNVRPIWVGSFGGPPLEVNGRDVTTSVVTAWTNAGAAFYVPWRCDVIGTASTAHFGSTLASGTVELRIVDLATLTQQGIWPQSINTAPAQIALPGDFQLPAAGWYQMQIRFAAAPANPADTARLDGEVIRFRPDPV